MRLLRIGNTTRILYTTIPIIKFTNRISPTTNRFTPTITPRTKFSRVFITIRLVIPTIKIRTIFTHIMLLWNLLTWTTPCNWLIYWSSTTIFGRIVRTTFRSFFTFKVCSVLTMFHYFSTRITIFSRIILTPFRSFFTLKIGPIITRVGYNYRSLFAK